MQLNTEDSILSEIPNHSRQADIMSREISSLKYRGLSIPPFLFS